VSSDAGEAADSLDYVIDTVPVHHPLEPYLSLLKMDGKLPRKKKKMDGKLVLLGQTCRNCVLEDCSFNCRQTPIIARG
jgi:hypothetical protein